MAEIGSSTVPYITWRNPQRAVSRADWFTSKVASGRYEVRQQQESGRWALVAVFTVVRRAA